MESNRKSRRVVPRIMTGAMAVALTGVALGWWVGSARAGGISANNPLQYAGTLAEQGVPVNGTRSLEIVLWNDAAATAAANKMCDTNAGSTPVVQGRFTVLLGNDCAANIATNPDTWAEVFVGGTSFGRQKIGAVPYSVISGAVNGLVNATAILPAYNTVASLGTGAGGASIYNDSTTEKALVITGNNVAGGGAVRDVSLHDNVNISGTLSVTGNETVPTETVTTLNITSHIQGNGVQGMVFGGMYCANTLHGQSNTNNPLTGGQSCPAGFTANSLFYTADVASCSSTCGGLQCWYCSR
jgi:hypothetical protein